MGSFSIWHWIVLLLFLAVPLILIGGVIWLVVYLSRRRGKPSPHMLEQNPPAAIDSVDARLRKLKSLLEQGVITQDEYERQRASIISNV